MQFLKHKMLVFIALFIPMIASAQYMVHFPNQGRADVVEVSCTDMELTCETGFVSWDDGRTYEGAIKDGLPHGEGKMRWSKEIYYEGSFKEGKRHGFGKMVGKEMTYDGEWIADKIGDQGAVIFKNGDEYLGAFNEGTIHGKGTMRFKNGSLYSGDWWKGSPHGEGTWIRTDKSKFTGLYQYGYREGAGMITWSSGDTLQGNWKMDKLSGKAQYLFNNHDVLEMNWRGGKLSTKAQYIFEDGETLSGSFTDIKEEANLNLKHIMNTESNFQLASLGIAMEYKHGGDYDLAGDFLKNAKVYASNEVQRYDLIDKVIQEVEKLQKQRGMANLPKTKAE